MRGWSQSARQMEAKGKDRTEKGELNCWIKGTKLAHEEEEESRPVCLDGGRQRAELFKP